MTLEYLIETLVKIFIVINVVLITVSFLVYMERKISAWVQDRIGPNRVGPAGLLQSFADVFKLLLKEDIVPTAAEKGFHRLAPIISLSVALCMYALIPFGDHIMIAGYDVALVIVPNVNIGILFIFALSSLGVYGVTLSGWASNNKYSLMGGLRSSAQMLSYELSLGLSVIGVLMIAGTLQLNGIIHVQQRYLFGFLPAWNVFLQPVGFVIFVIAMFAETNRAPFDLPEAEPELVGGFHTEYSGLKFGMFFLAEYANIITASALITVLFCGGWQIPYAEHLGLSGTMLSLAEVLAFVLKVSFWLFIFILVRWTVPRFRYDQLMRIGWKVMLPLALANIIVTAVIMQLVK
ncbi:MAG TPA: NADH-quinone oxidoreductase subunit NuoH [Candidatus Kapabacteria bacterium]|nr:NADH-quinone oxidoreductase subunit NuoH [Candidatus Kapabacteria bacterium]